MDLTFILAVIFTLFAIVVATALFLKSSNVASASTTRETKKAGGLGLDRPVHNLQTVEDCTALSTRSSQDHLSEESHLDPRTEELGTAVEQSTSTLSGHEPASSLDTEELGTAATVEQSTSTLSGHKPASSLAVDLWPSSETSSPGRGHRPYIGLSDTELLKCAFSHSQADGLPESLGILDDTEFKYAPGAVRTQQMQSMMSKDELEEERRVQREQLTAIFQLLKDNQETFGDVSEGDMDQQLKLYSI